MTGSGLSGSHSFDVSIYCHTVSVDDIVKIIKDILSMLQPVADTKKIVLSSTDTFFEIGENYKDVSAIWKTMNKSAKNVVLRYITNKQFIKNLTE